MASSCRWFGSCACARNTQPASRRSGRDTHGPDVPVPQLERQELPDLLGVVLAACLLIGDEPEYRFAADHAGFGELAVDEHVMDQFLQVMADPGTKRRAEGGLRPVHDLVRQPGLGGLLERQLATPSLDLLA